MNGSAQSLRQQVRIGSAHPAQQHTSLASYRGVVVVGFGVSGEVIPSAAVTFAALRHECAATTPNLRIAGQEETFVPVVPIERQGERFNGKHGKITVIRK